MKRYLIAVTMLALVAVLAAGCARAPSLTPTPTPTPPAPKPSPTPTPTPTPTLSPSPSPSPPAAARYNLSITVNPPGSGSASPSSGFYDTGTQLTLQATPSGTCWIFDRWSGDVTGNTNPIPVTLNANKNIAANFTRVKYTLAVTVTPAGSGSVGPAGGTYDCGESVTLTAKAASDYQFDRWGGDASSNSVSTNVTMNSNKNVMAYFKTLYQTIKRDLPAGSMTATSVSYSNQLKAGERIQGYVELTGEYHAGDAFYSWNFQIIGPGGAPVHNWDGNVVTTQHHDFDFTAQIAGKYIMKVSHVSRWAKSLTIQIRPGGWEGG